MESFCLSCPTHSRHTHQGTNLTTAVVAITNTLHFENRTLVPFLATDTAAVVAAARAVLHDNNSSSTTRDTCAAESVAPHQPLSLHTLRTGCVSPQRLRSAVTAAVLTTSWRVNRALLPVVTPTSVRVVTMRGDSHPKVDGSLAQVARREDEGEESSPWELPAEVLTGCTLVAVCDEEDRAATVRHNARALGFPTVDRSFELEVRASRLHHPFLPSQKLSRVRPTLDS